MEIEHCSYQQTYAPLNFSYTRLHRFKNMMTMLFFPSAAKHDEPVLRLFAGKTFHTIAEMKETLRHSKLKNKRYCNLHLFAKLFLVNYIPPKTNTNRLILLRERIGRCFLNLESSFNLYSESPTFFNYAWLLRKLLHRFKLQEFLPYLKKLKNKKRCVEYQERLTFLTNKSSEVGL